MSNADSDDYTTDENSKRKREAGKEDPFNRSKKTARTPVKTNSKSEDKFEAILSQLREIKIETGQIKEIKDDMRKMRSEIQEYKEEVHRLRKDNENLKNECKSIKEENLKIKNELQEMENRIEMIEKVSKENNIIVTGLEIDQYDTEALTEKMGDVFKDHLQVEVNIKKAFKLGKKTCLIELNNSEDKKAVMQNKYKLKENKNESIFINDDLTKREMNINKEIRSLAKKEKDSGKKVKIGYRKLTINDEVWRWNKSKEKLEKDPKN